MCVPPTLCWTGRASEPFRVTRVSQKFLRGRTKRGRWRVGGQTTRLRGKVVECHRVLHRKSCWFKENAFCCRISGVSLGEIWHAFRLLLNNNNHDNIYSCNKGAKSKNGKERWRNFVFCKLVSKICRFVFVFFSSFFLRIFFFFFSALLIVFFLFSFVLLPGSSSTSSPSPFPPSSDSFCLLRCYFLGPSQYSDANHNKTAVWQTLELNVSTIILICFNISSIFRNVLVFWTDLGR